MTLFLWDRFLKRIITGTKEIHILNVEAAKLIKRLYYFKSKQQYVKVSIIFILANSGLY